MSSSKARKKLEKLEEKTEEVKKKEEVINTEVKSYQIIYPCYIDSEKKSLKEEEYQKKNHVQIQQQKKYLTYVQF